MFLYLQLLVIRSLPWDPPPPRRVLDMSVCMSEAAPVLILCDKPIPFRVWGTHGPRVQTLKL